MIYSFIRPNVSVEQFESHLEHSQDGEIRIFCTPTLQLKNELVKWAENTGKAEFLCDFQDGLGLVLKDELLIVELKQIVQKWSSEFPTLAVGVGTHPFDAYKAMIFGTVHKLDSMVFYTPEIGAFFEEQLEKAEGAPNPADFALDLPEFDTKHQEKTKDAGKSNIKSKVVETLALLKEKAPVIAQLKEADPKAFEAIMKIVETLTALAKEGLVKNLNKDELPGGLADDADDSEFDPEDLKEGIAVEMEHTNDPKIAKNVAKDHLKESRHYYKDLKVMEAQRKAKDAESLEKKGKTGEYSKPEGFGMAGWIENGKITVVDKDIETNEKIPGRAKKQVPVRSGMVLGETGRAASAKAKS